MTGGGVFITEDPAKIGDIFLKAVALRTQVGPVPLTRHVHTGRGRAGRRCPRGDHVPVPGGESRVVSASRWMVIMGRTSRTLSSPRRSTTPRRLCARVGCRAGAGGHALSGSQLRALLTVEKSPGINLRGLARRLSMILSSASRLCDRLVAAGLLDRAPGRLDRREIALSLTPVGAALLVELRSERRRRLAGVLAGMSASGRDALLSGLREFGVTLDAAAGPDASL